jgi:hypothetical protein
MVIYSNTAPRKETLQAMVNNAGEGLYYAQLRNGAQVVAVNAGYAFSFIKQEIQTCIRVKVENEGSQFRSRDFYPRIVAHVIQENTPPEGEIVNPLVFPDPPLDTIVWIDGYGNIKTAFRRDSIHYKPGEKIHVTIQGVERTALVSGGSFSVAEGELAFSIGSSGYNNPFMELFLRGGSAHALFDNCPMESRIVLR